MGTAVGAGKVGGKSGGMPAFVSGLLSLGSKQLADAKAVVKNLTDVETLVRVGGLTLALAAPWIAPQNPYDLAQLSILDNMLPPGAQSTTTELFASPTACPFITSA